MQASPEGLIVARNGDLYAVALAGGRTVRLTRTSAWETAATVSADGNAIAYQRARKRADPPELWSMRVDGGQQHRLGVRGGSPTWTPDGRTLYFARSFCCEICANIWRVSADGHGATGVTRKSGLDTDPAVSPDGRTLAFGTGECEPGIPCCIVAMNLGTRRTRALPRLPASLDGSFHPTWAPDGKQIAFSTGIDDPSRIYLSGADGSGARPITRNALFSHSPEWSPDGALIAVIGVGTTPSDEDVWVVKPDGTRLKRVTRSKGREFSADWLPRMPPG